MQNRKVVQIGINFFPWWFYAVSSFPTRIWYIWDRCKICFWFWIFKNFNAQKFLGCCLSQSKALADPLCPVIELYAHDDESDASIDRRTLLQSIICTFWSFMIIPPSPYLARNFHIYQHTENCSFRRFSNKMLKIGATIRNFDL